MSQRKNNFINCQHYKNANDERLYCTKGKQKTKDAKVEQLNCKMGKQVSKTSILKRKNVLQERFKFRALAAKDKKTVPKAREANNIALASRVEIAGIVFMRRHTRMDHF